MHMSCKVGFIPYMWFSVDIDKLNSMLTLPTYYMFIQYSGAAMCTCTGHLHLRCFISSLTNTRDFMCFAIYKAGIDVTSMFVIVI